MTTCTHLDQILVDRPEHVAGCENCSYCYVDDLAFVLQRSG